MLIRRLLGSSPLTITEWVNTKYITLPINIAATETIGFDDERRIYNFSKMCHRVVTDRPDFSLNDRINIYKKWLGSHHPCLMAAKDRKGDLIAATIILPLTYQHYVRWWLNWLDCLHIGPEHMEVPGSKPGYRYLLVDLAARNQSAIRALSHAEQLEYTGLAFRLLLFHLSKFIDTKNPPIIFCGTVARALKRRLTSLCFERNNFYLSHYRLDVSSKNVEEEIRLFRSGCLELIECYQRGLPN